MDIKNLQCFIAAAEHLSFSRAAQALYISQPSLSIRINALEDELGVKLFRRTHQKVYLTNEGSALLPAARDIMDRIYNLKNVVDASSDATVNIPKMLKVGVDEAEDRSLSIITNSFISFKNNYPDIDLRITGVTNPGYESMLLSSELDLCIVVLESDSPVPSPFLSAPLLTEPVVLAAAHTGGMSLSEVISSREAQLLNMNPKDDRWNEMYLGFFRKYNPNVEPSYVNSASVLLMNLAFGGTITILPRTFAESCDIEDLTLYDVDIPHSGLTLALVWNKLNINSSIQLMINEFRSEQEKEG